MKGPDLSALVEWMPYHLDAMKQVTSERFRQINSYGFNRGLEIGTGPNVQWLAPLNPTNANYVELRFREDYEDYKRTAEDGQPTWMHLIREEVGEAFKEDDLTRLEEEITQVAALCISLVEVLHWKAEQARLEGTGQ